MATVFVDSNASGASDGTSWADAFSDLYTALGDSGTVAGSIVYIAHNHTKTYGANTTFSNNGTAISPIFIECVNTTTGAPATTATEQTTGSYSLYFVDHCIISGLTIIVGRDFYIQGDTTYIIKNSLLSIDVVNSVRRFNLGYYDDTFISLYNVLAKFSYNGQCIRFGNGCTVEWIGGGIAATSVAVDTPLKFLSGKSGNYRLVGLDLSNCATALMTMSTTMSGGVHTVDLIGCKLPASLPLLSAYPLSVPHRIKAHSCDNGDGYWYFEEVYIEGQIAQATNCYLNATYDDTNGFSAKMVSSVNAIDQKRPLRFKLSEFYAAANPTLTVELIGTTTLQNDEFWLEIEYPNSTSEALRDIDDSSRQEIGWSGGTGSGTPTNLTTSTESWTENLTGEVKQKSEVTISGGAAGIHTVWACLAKPSTTVYVDPDVTVS